ncbi:MAG: type II toxin-antitoxin system Y4mF family antitoxin [bacterium]|nr:type II toxin-antitoxin system Y4mF family antitoxin [bacterium]
MDPVKQLGKLIRTVRKTQGLTQSELGQYAGTGLNFISQLERGKPNVRFDKLLDVLEVIGLRLRVEVGKDRIVLES